MKRLLIASSLILGLTGISSAEVIFGGTSTTDLNNWTTSSVPFDDTVQSGHSMNWENVLVNEAVVDLVDNEFDLTWDTTTNHTIGHLFMYNETVDLSTLTPGPGVSALLMTANFAATAHANWSPVISVTDAGTTTYYRWNHSGNSWNGNGTLNFSDPFPAGDPFQFDLSQLGNGTNGATGIWGELVSTATGFGGTRINASGPDLQAATGTLQFGFIQWTASTGGNLPLTELSTAVEFFEVVVDPGPVGDPTVLNIPPADITAVDATVGAEVTATGNELPFVTIFWGTTDGTTNPANWDDSLQLGLQVGPITTALTGLMLDTTYHYRAFAENFGGSDWADSTESFMTLSTAPPTVVSVGGAATGPLSASLAGEVTDTGNEAPNVTLYYGTADGGTDPGSWDSTAAAGIQSGAFTTNVGGLDPSTTYFYRHFAENGAGADWADTAATVTTNAPDGLDGELDSAAFAFNYEMDENPSGQDLDAAGSATDWFAATAGGFTIPQTYAGGVAFSNASPGGDSGQIDSIAKSGNEVTLGWTLANPAAVDIFGSPDLDPTTWTFIANVPSGTTTFLDEFAFDDEFYYRLEFPPSGPPEVLFRTDFGGSIQRESLLGGDFTMEFAVRVISKPDPTDVGIFGVAIDPGGATSSFRLNIDADEMSLDADGNSAVATGDNTDAFHVYRIAYNATDDFYWAWRDGVLIYGTDTDIGVFGTNGGFNNNGSFFIGDFTGSLSGEWEVDYIRLNATDVAPVGILTE